MSGTGGTQGSGCFRLTGSERLSRGYNVTFAGEAFAAASRPYSSCSQDLRRLILANPFQAENVALSVATDQNTPASSRFWWTKRIHVSMRVWETGTAGLVSCVILRHVKSSTPENSPPIRCPFSLFQSRGGPPIYCLNPSPARQGYR